MAERIGIFICECGPNIIEAINLEQLSDYARGLKNVVHCEILKFACDATGKAAIEHAASDYRLTRVVVAGCSPKEHEKTFRKTLSDAGLNPFLLQIVNIREQCAWVIKDREKATITAEAHLSGAVHRIIYHEPLTTPEIFCCTDVLVVGAGVAGISAALTLAREGRKVYLAEKSPFIGGKVTDRKSVV